MDAYGKALLALKPEGISEEDLKKAHDFAVAEALKTTEKQTHQAMEALIHNLNTMNSRAGARCPSALLITAQIHPRKPEW